MIVTPYKTEPIVVGDNLNTILDTFLPQIQEEDIVVITSKIVSICEKNAVKISPSVDKKDLIHKQCHYYLPHEAMPRYGFILTITNGILMANSGIDESNGNGYYILWPKNIQKTTNDIWMYLKKRNNVKHIGVIITDSHSISLRWGVTGIGLSFCGFRPLYRYIGKKDIFGRVIHSVNSSILDGLSASAVSVMGEGREQTPLAVIRKAHNVLFQDHPPTKKDLESLSISLEDDLYAPLLTAVTWQKGGRP